MARTKDHFLICLCRLEDALAADVGGGPWRWASQVGDALGSMARLLRKARTDYEADTGLSGVDLNRPSLARQARGLSKRQANYIDEARSLRRQLLEAAHFLDFPAEWGTPAYSGQSAGRGEVLVLFEQTRRKAERLLTALRHHRDAEASLVLESVDTDLGTGD